MPDVQRRDFDFDIDRGDLADCACVLKGIVRGRYDSQLKQTAMGKNFYRRKYLIALYDEDDQIFAVADNISELMGFLSIPVDKKATNRVSSKISHALERESRRVRFGDRDLFVYLIPMEDEKEEELWELVKK